MGELLLLVMLFEAFIITRQIKMQKEIKKTEAYLQNLQNAIEKDGMLQKPKELD